MRPLPVRDEARQLDLCCHIRELELDRLESRDRTPECGSLLCVSQRSVEARLCQTDREGRDRHPTTGKRVQELSQASAPATQQVLLGHPAGVECQRVGVRGMPAQLSIGGQNLVPGGAGRDQDGADLAPRRAWSSGGDSCDRYAG